MSADIDRDYRPDLELLGDTAATLQALAALLKRRPRLRQAELLAEIRREREGLAAQAVKHQGMPVHPLRLVYELQALLDADTTLCSDMGSFHIWMARHLTVHRPRQILISNGQQTLGVALPWAIAACLANPGRKVISVSGDGGFLFSAVELETAVRLKCNFVHLVWIDGSYNMVQFQQMAAYGRDSARAFRPRRCREVRRIDGRERASHRFAVPDRASATHGDAHDRTGSGRCARRLSRQFRPYGGTAREHHALKGLAAALWNPLSGPA